MKKIIVMLMFCISFTAMADGSLVKFPAGHKDGIMYLNKDREYLTEYIYTSKETIEAAKAGKPFPSGTVITLVEYYKASGDLKRYVVMEKRTGWGKEYSEDIRNGEWEFQAFRPDTNVDTDEPLRGCFSCHRSAASDDFVFSVDAMKSY